MAYSVPTFDTSTRNKLIGQAEQFAPNIDPYYKMLQGQGQQALQQAFQAAQQNIGAQFGNNFRMAQQRLGGSPLLADSGYSNRLNRQLQQSAFGDLSNAYSQAAANQGQTLQQQLAQLIQQRLGARNDYLSAALSGAQKKQGIGGTIGGALGSIGGAFLGPYLGGLGAKASGYKAGA